MPRTLAPRIIIPVLLSVWPLVLSGRDFYITPDGSDAANGSKSAPFASLAKGRDAARPFAGREPVTVHVADGIYYLPETLVLTPEDSGSKNAPVVYRAANEGKAVLSGGLRLKPAWKPYRDGIYQTETPAGLEIDQLFMNGTRQHMARYPDFDPAKTTAAYQGYAADAISKERAARWADPAGGFIHAMHRQRWGGYHYRITGKNPDGTPAYEGGWQNNRQMGMHPEFRMVENIFEELDAPGEWFHDGKKNILYVFPPSGIDLGTAAFEAVRLPHLIECKGSAAKPVRHVTFQGFDFRHAARTFMETKEPLLRSDWAIYRGGAVLLTGVEDLRVLDSKFDQVGGNAIVVNLYARRVVARGCHIVDPGASGVVFVGDPKAVRDPLFEYGQHHDLSKIDRAPGPVTPNYPADCAVEDCLIHGIGRVERQAAGVQISMSARIAIRDCSIYDGSRAGINIGDGTWGGHLIERCDIFNTVLETHDHGSFNSWGRDRFWDSNHRGVSEPAVKADPKLPFLDAVETTVIRDSRWRCDHGWDIDLDDGSGNYDIYNNLMLNGGLKFREGYRRHAWNNIMVNNGFHPHVWFADSGDRFFSNIVMAAPKGVQVPTDDVRGKEIDRNLYFRVSSAEIERFHRFDWDRRSVVADPLFMDPSAGDFRVREGSPALKLGFKNFPMDRFGVKKATLKDLAKSPEIPALTSTAAEGGAEPDFWWEGVRLRSIGGEEFSAFGTKREDGGVQLAEIPAGAPALKRGLLVNDLIQSANGRPVRNLADFRREILTSTAAPLVLSVVRQQMPVTVRYQPAAAIMIENAGDDGGFRTLRPTGGTPVPTSSRATANDPPSILTDGALGQGYGPVFQNGIRDGAYRVDLGSIRSVTGISSWSFNMNGNRGPQRVTLFGSDAEQDPGWNLSDRKRYTPLSTLDTTGSACGDFQAVSMQAAKGGTLGRFRWIVWSVAPVTAGGENTAFRELSVTTVR